jgi:hypothetical protein
MAIINMVLQGKGGVGKSLMASLLAQYYLSMELPTVCIDTDPVNATLAGYKAFKAIPLDIMNGGDDVDSRQFDKLIETMLELPEETQLVIDNGAATFLPFCSYLAENAIFDLLKEQKQVVRIHSVVTGGQALLDTLSGLSSLLNNFKGTLITVWLNPFFGPIRIDGKEFEEMSIYADNREAFEAVIQIPDRRKETFGKDFEQLLSDRLTFAQAQNGAAYPIMTRQRLSMIWRDIETALTLANL